MDLTKSRKEKVDSIKEKALALGWTRKELYSNKGKYKFPCGFGWGLISFLDKKRRIGEVTEHYIEIITSGPHCDYSARYFRWKLYYPGWETKEPYGPDEKATIKVIRSNKKKGTPRTRKAPRKGKMRPIVSSS